MTQAYDVGVVGLGVAGAAVATLLAQQGHRVTLLEQADRLGPLGAGVLLQPSGQAVLEHLGLREAVCQRAAPITLLNARHWNGRPLIQTRYTDFHPDCRAYGVHRGVLFDALHRLLRQTSASIQPSCEIRSRQLQPDGRVTLHDTCGGEHGPFDFVLATDGSRSRMRDACGLPARVTPYNHGTLWIIVPGTGVPGQLLQVVRGNRYLFGLLPLGDGLVTLYWGVRAEDVPTLRERGIESLKAEILAFAPEAESVLEHVIDWEQLLFTSYQHVHQPRWYDSHTLFLGDACHAMSPHLGQGVNLALLDAWQFARSLGRSASPRAAFAHYARARRVSLGYYATVTYLLSPFFQSDWNVLGWGRDWVLPILPHLPWVRRQMGLTVCGLKGGFLRGAMSI
jgi:2-polyprenyl-6-methoxyphenol hydroxylase-like FAD-dependent oxidoreductase